MVLNKRVKKVPVLLKILGIDNRLYTSLSYSAHRMARGMWGLSSKTPIDSSVNSWQIVFKHNKETLRFAVFQCTCERYTLVDVNADDLPDCVCQKYVRG